MKISNKLAQSSLVTLLKQTSFEVTSCVLAYMYRQTLKQESEYLNMRKRGQRLDPGDGC